jgi:hypothetical protein
MTVTIVLALASLSGAATEIGTFLFFVMPIKVAKAGTVMCHHCHVSVGVTGVITLTFANGNTALIC